MTFTQDMLETMAAWCRDSLELAEQRRQARAEFFGEDDPRPIKHWGGAEEFTARERRFLGYFLLQGRHSPDETPRPELPRDDSLEAAVERMTIWAETYGHRALVKPAVEWEALVTKHFDNPATTEFYANLFGQVNEFGSEEELKELAGLGMNIWNNTPQPDRGGLTANQIVGLAPQP